MTLSASPPFDPWIVDTVMRGVPLNFSPRRSKAVMYALSLSGILSIASDQIISHLPIRAATATEVD